MLNCWYDT